MSRRAARFRVPIAFDGAKVATVRVFEAGGEVLLEVRPLRRRAAHAVPLSTVAQSLLERAAKARAEDLRRERLARRRRGARP